MKLKDRICNYLNRKKKAARNIIVLPEDIFIVSYPKSGNTWARFIVANLIAPERPIGFDNIEQIIPDIYQHTPRQLAGLRSPRVLKSHEYFDPRYKKVICVVRDPRDVAVSYWHHQLKFRQIDENYSKELFVQRFIAGDLDPFGSWGANIGSWLGARENDPDFLLVRYEDLLRNPAIELRRIASLVGSLASDELIEKAIAKSSFQQMQLLEQAQEHQWDSLKKTHQDMKFVRKGTGVQWRHELSEKSIDEIERAWSTLMDRFGYTRS